MLNANSYPADDTEAARATAEEEKRIREYYATTTNALRPEIASQVASATQAFPEHPGCLLTSFTTADDATEFVNFLLRCWFTPAVVVRGVSWRISGGECYQPGPRVVQWNPGDDRDNAYLPAGVAPQSGDVATRFGYTDKHPLDVIRATAKQATLRERTPIRVTAGKCVPGGFAAHWYEQPKWVSVPNPNGAEVKVSRRTLKSGAVVWKVCGWRTTSPGGVVKFGSAVAFTDFNF